MKVFKLLIFNQTTWKSQNIICDQANSLLRCIPKFVKASDGSYTWGVSSICLYFYENMDILVVILIGYESTFIY